MSKPRMIGYIIDDEPLIATTLEIILIGEGFDARSFVNPLDALSAAQSVAPNLLISDVVMPELNGFELAIQVTQLCPDCKVLMFSGQTATQALYDSAKSRGHDFRLLAKPVHPNVLLEEIRKLFAEPS
jgi:DNA-binding NtrC family response regulator